MPTARARARRIRRASRSPSLRGRPPGVARIDADDRLLHAMDVFSQSGAWVLPVVDAEGVFLGTVSKSTIFDRYRSELIVQTADRGE